MPKLYTKNTWVDETLAGAELYNIADNGGTPINSNVQINLATSVAVAGTEVNASRMNNIENGIDGLDSKLAHIADGTASTEVTALKAWLKSYFDTLYASITRSQAIMGNTGATNIASGQTRYITPGLIDATESIIYLTWPVAGTVKNLYVYSQGSPGVGQTYTATFRNNLADTTLTCQIIAGTNSANDTTHQVAVSAGQRWSLKVVSSASAAATNITFSFEFVPS
jgi:hypothetical protein